MPNAKQTDYASGIQDETFYIPPMCFSCVHYTGDNATIAGSNCKAFPDQIPNAILLGYVIHDKPIDGDHGIQFERLFSEEEEALLEDDV